MKKVLAWVAVAFVIFYISTDPARAADTVGSIGGVLAEVANNLGEFLRRLATSDG